MTKAEKQLEQENLNIFFNVIVRTANEGAIWGCDAGAYRISHTDRTFRLIHATGYDTWMLARNAEEIPRHTGYQVIQ